MIGPYLWSSPCVTFVEENKCPDSVLLCHSLCFLSSSDMQKYFLIRDGYQRWRRGTELQWRRACVWWHSDIMWHDVTLPDAWCQGNISMFGMQWFTREEEKKNKYCWCSWKRLGKQKLKLAQLLLMIIWSHFECVHLQSSAPLQSPWFYANGTLCASCQIEPNRFIIPFDPLL